MSSEEKYEWIEFDGFSNFPEFLMREFQVPKGKWIISKIERKETGLEVEVGEVKIWGDENYNYATILQLIMKRRGYIPKVKIEHEQLFPFRGFHLDIARGGVPTVEAFKRILRLLFLLKYNYFAIYFEDLFPWEKYPEIGRHRGKLTREEFQEVVEYGKKLGIEVFPSLELAGHMEHILALPEYHQFSEWHNPREGCLDVSNDEARKFVYELLKDAIDISPSKYVHIGGDETWAMGRGKSLNKTWKYEGPDLYITHHKNMVRIVKEKGKIPILWGDMLTGMYLATEKEREKWAEVGKSDVWKDVLIANWDYSRRTKEDFEERIKLFGERKLQQIVCPGMSNWNRYYPNFDVASENIVNFISTAKEEGLQGYLITAWGDDGEECLFSFLDPLLLIGSEVAEGNLDWEEKWLSLTGESNEILSVRKAFGQAEVADNIKHVLLADFWYYRMSDDEKRSLKESWSELLKRIENVNLPQDLEFIRRCIQVAVRRIEGRATPSDYIALANMYAKLWLNERKPYGLEKILERFWGAAGRLDARVR